MSASSKTNETLHHNLVELFASRGPGTGAQPTTDQERLGPKDETESLICEQMVGNHFAANLCFKRASAATHSETVARYCRIAAQLQAQLQKAIKHGMYPSDMIEFQSKLRVTLKSSQEFLGSL